MTKGFVPDASVCLGEVPESNPSPFMLWMSAIRLGLTPIECKSCGILLFVLNLLKISSFEAIVKVDDSANGILEGLLAGSWTVGIAKTSVYFTLI